MSIYNNLHPKLVFHGVVIIHLKKILKYRFGVEISKIIKQ